jgi:hypothetical protein
MFYLHYFLSYPETDLLPDARRPSILFAGTDRADVLKGLKCEERQDVAFCGGHHARWWFMCQDFQGSNSGSN